MRTALGIRPSTAEDFKAVENWLRQEVVPWDHDSRHLQDAVHEWYRSRLIEPPSKGRIERLVRSAVRMHEIEIFDTTAAKLSPFAIFLQSFDNFKYLYYREIQDHMSF